MVLRRFQKFSLSLEQADDAITISTEKPVRLYKYKNIDISQDWNGFTKIVYVPLTTFSITEKIISKPAHIFRKS